MKKTLYAKITDGELFYDDIEAYKTFLAKNNEKKLAIVLDTDSIRSIKQNSYYWGVVISTLGRELGYSSEDMHEILKHEFAPKRKIETRREAFEVVKSTTKMTTIEFMNFIHKCRILGGSLNINIPLPPNDCEFKPRKLAPCNDEATDIKNWHILVCVRYDYECQVCHRFFNHKSYFDENGNNQYVCGHHCKTKASSPELRLRVDNGLCVCLKCHSAIHNGSIKI